MANKDIVPKMLADIQNEFQKQFKKNKTVKKAYEQMKQNKADYAMANDFAISCGEMLSDALNKFITADTLPEGRMWYNIASRIMEPTLTTNYSLIADICENAQKNVNTKSKIGLNAIKPALDKSKVEGFVNKLSSDEFENVQWMLGEPVVNFSQSVVDDAIHDNAEFHAKAGVEAKIVRTLGTTETRTIQRGKKSIRYNIPCKWCETLAGEFDYGNMPPFIKDNIFRRHENCRCVVEYVSGAKRQNVWSKQIRDEEQENRAERVEAEKQRIKSAKNREEAYKILRDDVGFDLIEDSADKINEDLLKKCTEQLQKLENRFNIVHQSTGTFCAENQANAVGYVRSALGTPTRQNLSLCQRYYKKSFEDFILGEKNLVESFESMPCLLDPDTLSKYTVTHEYGHMLQNKLTSDYLSSLGWTPERWREYLNLSGKTKKAMFKFYLDADKTVIDNCFNEIVEIAKNNNPDFKLYDNLSTYGRTNKAEFFAEVFANSQLGAPNELGVAMQEWLERQGY